MAIALSFPSFIRQTTHTYCMLEHNDQTTLLLSLSLYFVIILIVCTIKKNIKLVGFILAII